MGKGVVKKEMRRRVVNDKLVDTAKDVVLSKSKNRCRICSDLGLRYFVLDLIYNGYGVWAIRDMIKKRFGFGIAPTTIEDHIENHDKGLVPLIGLMKFKFNSEEERKKFEVNLLSRVSLVFELWEKYVTLSELFRLVVGEGKDINPSVLNKPNMVTELSKQLREYLVELLHIQKERDIIVEVAKVVLYMLADRLIERLGSVVSDLSVERREIIGSILKEEVRNALEYAKTFGKNNRLDDLMDKVREEYERLVSKK